MIHVCILGPGLIGGSLGMALRRVKEKKKRKYFVSGWSRNAAHLERAKRLGALDATSKNPQDAVKNADIVILATPIQYFGSILSLTAKFLKPGAIVSDAGSVKGSVLKDIHRALRQRPDVDVVGCHPLAGSEKSGVNFASPTLFENSICVISDGKSSSKSRARIRSLWRDVGAKDLNLSPAHHDRSLAMTSHLPHLIAFAMVSLILKSGKADRTVMSLLGGSFRDATRVAASDPSLWTGIIEANRSDIKKATQLLTREISRLASASPAQLNRTLTVLSRQKKSW